MGMHAIRRGERMLKIVGKDKALIEDLPVKVWSQPGGYPEE